MDEKISYDEFAKVEVRVGTILTAEKVENADKLIRLTVDLGEDEPRQIVSGIAEYFPEPEVLVGKQSPFVTNLAPRTIRGLESDGMIFAVGGEKGITLLSPSQEVEPGAKLS